VGNVYDAMKKHEAEEAAKASAGQDAAAPAPGSSPDAAPTAEAPRRPPRPRLRTNGYAPELVAHCDRGGRLAEEYRALRTNLLAQYEDDRFCILITSSQGGEGKTVTCLNLGFVLAELPDRRTIIVDCDLQKGNVNALLEMPATPGLADGPAAVSPEHQLFDRRHPRPNRQGRRPGHPHEQDTPGVGGRGPPATEIGEGAAGGPRPDAPAARHPRVPVPAVLSVARRRSIPCWGWTHGGHAHPSRTRRPRRGMG